jgi:hypothetical protein
MTFTHRGVPVVNGLGVIFFLSHGDLTWNDKDLKMLDAITCGPRVSLISERVNWLRGRVAQKEFPLGSGGRETSPKTDRCHESRVKFVYFRDKLWHDEECLPH